MIEQADIDRALDRLARTPDGVLLYRFLQMRLMGTLAEHAPSERALHVEHGERRFAQALMAKMAKGIDESDGRNEHTGSRASERTVVIRRAEPRAVSASVTPRDFIRRSDPELASAAGILPGSSGNGSGA